MLFQEWRPQYDLVSVQVDDIEVSALPVVANLELHLGPVGNCGAGPGGSHLQLDQVFKLEYIQLVYLGEAC